MIAYRLTFEGPLRARAGGVPFPRSDTLTAALCSAAALLGDDAGRLAADPPFAVSSLFPFATGERGEPIHMLPRPLGSALDTPATPELRAERAAVRWLSPALFRWALGGEAAPETSVHAAQGGEIWSEAPVPVRLWSKVRREHRAFDRLAGAPLATAWSAEEIAFASGSGLYFLARWRDRGVRARCESVLRFLGDEGLGRSAPFRIEVDEGFRVPSPGGGGSVLLSLYHPTREEVERGVLRGARYELVLRGGVHASGAPRRVVRMLAEGARLSGAAPTGAAVRVLAAGEAPGVGHDVFRSGLALSAPAPAVAA